MLRGKNIKHYSTKKVCFYIGLSNAYGELFDAWHFLCKSFSKCIYIVPTDIFLKNQGSLLLDSEESQLIEIPELERLEEVLVELNLDVLVLASGYQMDPDFLSTIIALSEKLSISLCTTDPFNGLWADMLASSEGDLHEKLCKEQVKTSLERCKSLKEITHIYALPINNHSHFNRKRPLHETSQLLQDKG